MTSFLNVPLRFRFSSQTRLQRSIALRIISLGSVMPGNMGDMKHVVRIPASWSVLSASSLRDMGAAESMSRLNDSSRVLIEIDTRASGNVLMMSMSLSTRSDLVAMLILAPLPSSCFSSVLVRWHSASCGL